jgi:hypothetical protein
MRRTNWALPCKSPRERTSPTFRFSVGLPASQPPLPTITFTALSPTEDFCPNHSHPTHHNHFTSHFRQASLHPTPGTPAALQTVATLPGGGSLCPYNRFCCAIRIPRPRLPAQLEIELQPNYFQNFRSQLARPSGTFGTDFGPSRGCPRDTPSYSAVSASWGEAPGTEYSVPSRQLA